MLHLWLLAHTNRGLFVGYPYKIAIMTPGKYLGFSTHCVENVGEELVELYKLV